MTYSILLTFTQCFHEWNVFLIIHLIIHCLMTEKKKKKNKSPSIIEGKKETFACAIFI